MQTVFLRHRRSIALLMGATLLLIGYIAQAQRDASAFQAQEHIQRSGWFGVRWKCYENRPHEPEYLLMYENGTSSRLEVPAAQIRSYGGSTPLNGTYVTVQGTLGKQNGRETIRVDDLDQVPLKELPKDKAPRNGGGWLGASKQRRFLTILVRFSDVGSTTHPLSYYEALAGGTYPGMLHYWNEASYNTIDVGGATVLDWRNLPHPKSYYLNGTDLDVEKLLNEAAALVDADVDFRNYYGIHVMINDVISTWAGLGGPWTTTLDGETRVWGATVQVPVHRQSTCAHEMGHTFGMLHSSGPYSATYDSGWDIMSGGRFNTGTQFAEIGVHVGAFNKQVVGIFPQNRRYLALPGTTKTINLERLAQPVSATNPLVSLVLKSGSATRFYTVEFRQKVGYDDNPILPGNGVVIHDVDLLRGADRLAQVVDPDNNGDPNDAAAIWTAGETFTDAANGITIKVNSINATSANVTVTVSAGAPQPHIVTNTNDTGAGSLRNALYFANLKTNVLIDFRIPTSDPNYFNGVFTIKPLSPFPPLIQSGAKVDGTTQTVNMGDTNPNGPEILIQGTSAGAYGVGFTLTAPTCLVRGLAIGGFNYYGVWLRGAMAQKNTVQGNYIGTDALGTSPVPNTWGVGITDGAKTNQIGGTGAGQGNLVSGNYSLGVSIEGALTSGNTVLGNRIGTDRLGNAALPNAWGIYISAQSKSNRVGGPTASARNIISGNSSVGIGIDNAPSNIIQGNWIGIKADGSAALPNVWGIYLTNGAQGNIVGGSTTGNVISGNSVGIGVLGAHSNVAQGNFVGVAPDGSTAIPNVWGFWLSDGSHNNRIGTSGAGNLICGNSLAGIGVVGAHYNQIQANLVGVLGDLTTARGNGTYGVWLKDGAVGNAVGGTASALQNRIANQVVGVNVSEAASVSNSIRGNRIYNNSAIGINLNANDGSFGVTNNDAGDADTGPNNLQNYPVITSVVNVAGTIRVFGTLNATPNTRYLLDIYTNSTVSASGYGEGEQYEGTVSVLTNASGNVSFIFAKIMTGARVAVTATHSTLGDTSEFSLSASIP